MSAKTGQHTLASPNGGVSREFMEEVTRRIEEREAHLPSPPRPPEAFQPDKPHALTTAEKELRGWETCRRLRELLCTESSHCARPFCRRHKRCVELRDIDAEIAKARSRLAVLQTKWPAPRENAPRARLAATDPACRRRKRCHPGRRAEESGDTGRHAGRVPSLATGSRRSPRSTG
jgi:hypothetical protein